MLIAVLNNSTLITNDQANTMCLAIQKQLDLHFLPAYNLKSGTVQFYADKSKVPGYAWTLYLIDNDISVPDALGYHQELNDKISGYIMCEPILSNGGVVMNFDAAKPDTYTVSGTLSHEVLEAVMDRYTNTFCDNGNVSWCLEVCDPVESISYGISVNGIDVSLSDFVFPSFWNPEATLLLNAPFNYLNTLKESFSLLPGGYAIQRAGGPGTETQVFGEMMPQWRRDQKMAKFSRRNRRTK